MKFGTYYAYWTQEWKADYHYFIDKVKKIGFDILEVGAADIGAMTDDEIKAIRDHAGEAGISMTAGMGMPREYDLTSTDAACRERGMDRLRKAIVGMEKLGVNLIGGILYSYWPYDYTQPVDKPASWKLAVQGMRDIAGFAADHGVTLGMEVVNRFEHYMLNTAEEGIRFVKEVDRPNIRVMLDCFHMNIEEDWHGDAIRATGDLLCHFHIGDANRKVPGQGHMPWDEIGKGLRDIGYDKAVVMEPFVKPGGTVGREIKVWRDLSNGADEERLDREIAEALQFVKKKFVG